MPQDTKSGSLSFAPLSFGPLSFGATESGGVGGIPEAPLDGQAYARKMAAWAAISTDGGNSGIPEAPSDGMQYGRQDGAWTPIIHESGESGIPDAPYDDVLYGRKNGIWTRVPESGGGATGLYPEIVAGTTTPVTVGESDSSVELYAIPSSIIGAAIGSVLTVDILAYGALDTGYRQWMLKHGGYIVGSCDAASAKTLGVRFATYIDNDFVYPLPGGYSPYAKGTSAMNPLTRYPTAAMRISVIPGITGSITMNACIVTKWRAPA